MFLPFDGHWHKVKRTDVRARELADRHYSRQTPGARDFMASGKTLVLLTEDARAVWGVIENLDPVGNLRWRCSIFRNEGSVRSSELITEATERTYRYWLKRFHGLPAAPLETEVDPEKTRHKRDPGRCFRKAGWVVDRIVRGLVVLRAPTLAILLSACSFEMPELSGNFGELPPDLPQPGPRPAAFECTLDGVTVRGESERITSFAAEGEPPVFVYSEDAVTDLEVGGVNVIVVGDLLIVGERWVRLGEC